MGLKCILQGQELQPSDTLPKSPGTAAIGSSTLYARADHVHPQDDTKLDKSGGTMTGSLVLNGDPTENLEAATKQYVDNHSSGDGSKIGDIKITARTDLGDNWLLCNGDIVPATNYPGYCELFGEEFAIDQVKSSNHSRPLCAAYAEDKNCLVVGGETTLQIFYTTNDGDSWTTTSLGSSISYSSDKQTYIYKIKYIRGTWLACISWANGSGYYYSGVYFTDDITSNTWTKAFSIKKPYSTSKKTGILDIIYQDGRWIACGSALSSGDSGTEIGRIYTTANESLTGTWTATSIFTTYSSFNSIAYNDGYYVVGGHKDSKACIAYSTDLSSWTAVFFTEDTKNNTMVNKVICANGTWAAVGKDYKNSYYQAKIWTTQDPSSTWTAQILSQNTSYTAACTIAFLGNRWLIGGAYIKYSYDYPVIWESDSPQGPWEEKNPWEGVYDDVGNEVNSFTVGKGGGIIATGARVYYDSSYSYYGKLIYLIVGKSAAKIPVVSIDNTYAYIKAKEETT